MDAPLVQKERIVLYTNDEVTVERFDVLEEFINKGKTKIKAISNPANDQIILDVDVLILFSILWCALRVAFHRRRISYFERILTI